MTLNKEIVSDFPYEPSVNKRSLNGEERYRRVRTVDRSHLERLEWTQLVGLL